MTSVMCWYLIIWNVISHGTWIICSFPLLLLQFLFHIWLRHQLNFSNPWFISFQVDRVINSRRLLTLIDFILGYGESFRRLFSTTLDLKLFHWFILIGSRVSVFSQFLLLVCKHGFTISLINSNLTCSFGKWLITVIFVWAGNSLFNFQHFS